MNSVLFWHWWIGAAGLLIIEMLSPGFFFLGMAIAAALIGLLLLVIPILNIETQLLSFALLSISSIIAWKRYMTKPAEISDHPLLNQRGAQYIGRTFTVIEAIENGQGKIKADDSHWKVEGEDCPIGSSVKVIAVRGTIFKVIRL
jgi:membrane protein implicated in regulation of membrane protease activity